MNLKKICVIITSAFLFLDNFCYSFPTFDKLNFKKISKTLSILLYNVNSGWNVFEKNIYEKMYPASLTKIMTFIVVNDCTTDFERKIKINQRLLDSLNNTHSSLAELNSKYEYTVDELLKLMMICSGNDAALVLADYFGNGSVENFVQKMNKKAHDIGCKSTHFMNPHGLHHKNHYSSCSDMLKIVNYAMKIERFANIVKTQSIIIKGRTYKNTNKLLDPNNKEYYYENTRGIKTGYHSEAGYCLSSISEKNGIKFIGIFMGAPTIDESGKDISVNYAMKETKDLCESAFNNLVLRTTYKKISNTKVNFGPSGILMIPCKKNYEIKYMSPRDASKSDIYTNVCINPISNDSFPIKKGDILGAIEVKYKNDLLKKVDIVSEGDVDLSFRSVLKSMTKRLFLL